ncbi:glutathione hydrolase 3-like [Cynara cardunculus var. scolymus]|uniref:glutathione hydrolase 3-like n=1 Tax=Cynara cardunculus var. scolymus TaxID=59895 RepID=UPI000D62F4FE|nr:glutathione hydrolase 3-like [Cynara cardunculus var. scolymus]
MTLKMESMKTPFLSGGEECDKRKKWRTALWFLISIIALTFILLTLREDSNSSWVQSGDALESPETTTRVQAGYAVESMDAVVAADDARCSEIGASVLRSGGHAVDAAVAVALCLGVVNPMASGVGGGGFMIVRSAATSQSQAIDFRETAPLAASENMYENDLDAKYTGALSMGVPGEIAGLYKAWSRYGRLPWKTLFDPAIRFAKDGFMVAPYLAGKISSNADKIKNDPGLRQVFAPNGEVLESGDICYNPKLGWTLEVVANEGPKAFYDGVVGEKLVNDVQDAGGILTMEDLRNYNVEVMDALAVDTMGYTVLGMPAPSSGTLGLALVSNILESYESSNAAKGSLGLHRFIEALKHMYAFRMDLGDPDFVNISKTMADMLSPKFAKSIRERIYDNTTFPPAYYMPRWSQLLDHGTSHFCIVDADRNAVSMTTTVNYAFGGGVLSPSTGIVLNNEMGDFSVPTEVSSDTLPPSPSNFIRPGKRPLSSMTPIIILKDEQLAGVIGGSGGMSIIPAVAQVFLNHFVLGMDPSNAVQSPRVYHKLIPNVVSYENWTVIDGDHIELSDDRKKFLEERGHELKAKAGGAICQLIVQTLNKKPNENRKPMYNQTQVLIGMLTAVSDPRKDGRPAAC